MTRALALLVATSFLLPIQALAGYSSAAVVQVAADKARVKQLHDSKVKTSLGLPTFTFGKGYSTVSTKWTPGFRVTPPVEGWVTDWDEDAKDAVYTVHLSLIRFPDGAKRSLYTAAQKKELFKNMVGHVYKLSGKRLDQTLALPENAALFQRFASGIDGDGFHFPSKIRATR